MFQRFVFLKLKEEWADAKACRAVAAKAILVPTAERDGALGLAIFPPVAGG